ncbi:MAG: hypothetical protein IJI92_09380 [Erysipelotrichaceae bacterium]|nr:hypothetical protein [Erysipelotrichaceae bacterium]
MNRSKVILILIIIGILLNLFFGYLRTNKQEEEKKKMLTLEEYLDKSEHEWFLTGKKKYTVQAMMVSKETSFHNDLEAVDYTVNDDGETVILKGMAGEMWTSPLDKVTETYTKPDGTQISIDDFSRKDAYIDIVTIPKTDSNFAMFVPIGISVTVETASGDILHTNLDNAGHKNGDYLICRVDENGDPDLNNVWVLNGELFPEYYDTTNMR